MTGGAFKIYERKAPIPPPSPAVPLAKKSPTMERKKKVEVPPRVVRALKLVDEEESGAEMLVEAAVKPNP
jgi:hypothetical protein